MSMNKIIHLIGYPGSGKTTLAKELCEHLNYTHFEYDTWISDNTHYQNSDLSKVVIDAYYKNTEKLLLSINQYQKLGYNVSIIHLDIPKDKCIQNIERRGRSTIDINNENTNYDLYFIQQNYDVNSLVIKDYNYDPFILSQFFI